MRRVALWGPVLLWAGVIFFLSSRSDLGPAGRIPDWLPHGLAYAILSLLVARALSGGTLRPLSATDALGAVLIAALYGVSDEWHQSFTPGRDPSVADVAKDLAGAVVAVSVYRLACRRGPVPERARLG